MHLQVRDRAGPVTAAGVPILFRDYRVLRRDGTSETVPLGLPDTGAVVETRADVRN